MQNNDFEAKNFRPLNCCDCGFESRRGHGYLPLVIVVRYQVGVSALG